MWKPPRLETNRLILRAINETDKDDIYAYGRNPKNSLYTMWEPYKSVDDALAFIHNYAGESYQTGAPEPMGIELKETGQLVGCSGAFWVSKKSGIMELAYIVKEEYWGKGIVVEASRAVIDYCFKLHGIERLQCRCKEENQASLRVMEKLGFKYEGLLRSSVYHRNRYWNMQYTSILKSEWKKSQQAPFIRRAEFGDEEGIHIAHMRSIKENCIHDYNAEEIEAWSGRQLDLENRRKLIQNEAMWVAEDKGKIIGFGVLILDVAKSTAEIGGLYLVPEALGKGLAKEIIFYMKEYALLRDINEIFLTSSKTAKHFYASQGFIQYAENVHIKFNNVPIEGHPMKLELT